MKQTIFYAIALTVMMAVGTNSHAKSWRVNNDTTRGAQFADINAAMSSEEVQDGDTLYLDPGSTLTATQNVTKRVTIIGNGYFSDLQQPYPYASINGTVYLKAAGCKIEGVFINSSCTVYANNVTIERCRIGNSIISNGSNCQYATIRDCMINGSIRGNGATSTSSMSWTIESNIIQWAIQDLYSASIRYNYIYYHGSYSNSHCFYNIHNSTITNNIGVRKSGSYSIIGSDFVNNAYHHNLISTAEDTAYPNNTYFETTDESVIFTMTGPNDQKYMLCENSPAKGCADDGGNCGPYDGPYPYIPGGMPHGVPYYTDAVIGSMAHDGKVNVTLKIAVQDE